MDPSEHHGGFYLASEKGTVSWSHVFPWYSTLSSSPRTESELPLPRRATALSAEQRADSVAELGGPRCAAFLVPASVPPSSAPFPPVSCLFPHAGSASGLCSDSTRGVRRLVPRSRIEKPAVPEPPPQPEVQHVPTGLTEDLTLG